MRSACDPTGSSWRRCEPHARRQPCSRRSAPDMKDRSRRCMRARRGAPSIASSFCSRGRGADGVRDRSTRGARHRPGRSRRTKQRGAAFGARDRGSRGRRPGHALAGGHGSCRAANASAREAPMTLALEGALACALAVTSLALAPAFRAPVLAMPIAHPDRDALRDAGWTRSLLIWEATRAGATLLALVIAVALSLPPIPAMVAGAIAPSMAARMRADRAGRRARGATTRMLRMTEAALRSNAGVPEALRRAIGGTEDRLAVRPFAAALRAFDLGAPLDDALRRAAGATADPRVRVALDTLALGIASRLPGERAGALVAAVADRLAFHERLEETCAPVRTACSCR